MYSESPSPSHKTENFESNSTNCNNSVILPIISLNTISLLAKSSLPKGLRDPVGLVSREPQRSWHINRAVSLAETHAVSHGMIEDFNVGDNFHINKKIFKCRTQI